MGLARSKPALELLEKAENPPDAELQARRRMIEGWSLYSLAEYARAAELLEDAHRLAEGARSPILLAEVELRQAPLLQVANRFDESDARLRHALELATRAGDRYVQAMASGNLGFLFLNSLFRYDEAVYWFERSLALSKEIGASTLTAQTVGNLGSCYYYLGDFDKALANYREAEERFARVGNTRSRELWLGNSSAVYLEQEEFPEAVERSRRALEMARQINDRPRSIEWLINLAQANIGLGKLDTAEADNREAQALAEAIGAHRQRLYISLNAAGIAAGRRQFEQSEKLYKSVEKSDFQDPAATLDAQKGLAGLYLDAGEPGKADAQFRNTIAVIENRQTALSKIDDKFTYLSSLVRFYRSYVDFLAGRGEEARALEVVESSRARILMERPRSETAAQLQASARAGGATFLSYWLAPRRSYLWTISPAGIHMFVLPPEKEIRDLASAYRRVIEDIRDPLESHNPAGAKLSAILLGQIGDFVRPGSRVVIVPDGALHSLNFATLPAPNDPGKYWIEDVTISVAPSLQVLPGAGPAYKTVQQSLLAIGDPEPPGEEYPRLPSARKELNAIGALFADKDKAIYEGAASQPSVYRRSHPDRFSFIHFAAHATVNPAIPLDSALILSREESSYALTAREIARIPVNARMVTLSSCRSAGARVYSGEGLVGLAWAFLQAGARNVVAGLWDVDDESTGQLMSRMYRDVTRGVAPDDALRAAQLNFIHAARPAYRKPYYWGPFQLYIGTGRGSGKIL